MRLLLFYAFLIYSISAEYLTCPPKYELREGRCIQALTLSEGRTLAEAYSKYSADCADDGAHLPIIKNDKDSEFFRTYMQPYLAQYSGNVAMDIICNNVTHHLEWIDGTSPNYSPHNSVDFYYDCYATKLMPVDDTKRDLWFLDRTTDIIPIAYLCVMDDYSASKPTDPPVNDQCGDYSLIPDSEDREKPCFKVFTDELSWVFALDQCASDFGSLITINSAEENKYFWRTAIINNMLDGMHIGAIQMTEDTKSWAGIDGYVPISGGAYDNFISSFPIPGAGFCSAMLTESAAALWINEDCYDNKLSFICRRSDFSSNPKTCPKSAPPAGKDFFPPGFPTYALPCEYVLFVNATKLVEVEILTLVSNSQTDFLEIFEGPAGPNVLANLTGSIHYPTKFTTARSNVIRVNWKPIGATANGRGFRIQYREVDK